MMGEIHSVAVIDIGKTSAKLAMVDLEATTETVIAKTANTVVLSGPYPHFDTDRIWSFVLDALAGLPRGSKPGAIIATTHGASGALLRPDGDLALPILDYEYAGPESFGEEYDTLRPPFAEAGSPRLPGGLNLGAQLFWQSRAFPDAFTKAATFVTHPQYWAQRLCGSAANEATSLGAHSDLWNPRRRDFSSLVDRMGWRGLMAPVRKASERLGWLKPEVAARIGVSPETPVFCGIHDSNASLYPHLVARKTPFTVVSTGTWVIAMAVGGARRPLDPARDTLINVNAFGDPVPSARFMGGREFSLLLGDAPAEPNETDIARVLETPIILTPPIDRGSGPFQHLRSNWLPAEPANPGERFAAVSFSLALVTSTSLQLIGAAGDTIVEGPFAANRCFTKMLATASGRNVLAAESSTGTCLGAALLCAGGSARFIGKAETIVEPVPGWQGYAMQWRKAVE